MKPRKTIAKYCYIERYWNWGSEYCYVDISNGKESRMFNYEEQCIDEAKRNGYTIRSKSELKR